MAIEPKPKLFLAVEPDSVINLVPFPTIKLPSETVRSDISSRLEPKA